MLIFEKKNLLFCFFPLLKLGGRVLKAWQVLHLCLGKYLSLVLDGRDIYLEERAIPDTSLKLLSIL